MKIMFYTSFLTAGGGLEVAAIQYINEFKRKGNQVHVYIDYDMGNENLREKEIEKNIKIKYLKSEKLSKFIYKLRTLGKKNKIYNIFLYLIILSSDFTIWRKLRNEITKEKYDVTITFFQYLPGYINKISGPKHKIFLHGSVEHYFLGIRKYFKKFFFKKINKFTYICTVSNEMREQVLKIFPVIEKNKVRTIYNKINFDDIIKKSKDESELNLLEKKIIKEKYICSVGRIDEEQKDFKTLIETYRMLLLEVKENINLVLIGNGPDMEFLKKYTQKIKLENKIFFLGKKDNPYIWMKNCEIFILSSKFEGFGLVLAEALLLNKKVISSNCKVGPLEILENGKYGELFEIGNKEELKNKILKLMKEKNKIETKEYIMKKFGTGFKKLEELLEE